MKYLGIPLEKPKVGFFGFTGCEGCQLQIANKEETLGDLLGERLKGKGSGTFRGG